MRLALTILLAGCASAPACSVASTSLQVVESEPALGDVAGSTAREALGTVPPGPLAWYHLYGDLHLDDARSALLNAYLDHGYVNAHLEDDDVRFSAGRTAASITLRVDPGPRFHLGRVRVVEESASGGQSDRALPFAVPQAPALVSAAPGLRSGDWLSRSLLVRARDAIELAYREEGYARVSVVIDTEVDVERARIGVEYGIERGPIVTIDAIRVLDEDGEVPWTLPAPRPAERYRASEVAQAQEALQRAYPDREVTHRIEDRDSNEHVLLTYTLLRR